MVAQHGWQIDCVPAAVDELYPLVLVHVRHCQQFVDPDRQLFR